MWTCKCGYEMVLSKGDSSENEIVLRCSNSEDLCELRRHFQAIASPWYTRCENPMKDSMIANKECG